jgi:thioredoxin-related protein/dienelactone hydrolase
MKTIILSSLLLCFGLKPIAQGIHFEEGPSLAQMKAKAKAENKFLFIDCYATWCNPCRAMDSLTYPSLQAGDFFNAHFISCRIQMDSTKKDAAEIRAWYHDAHELMTTSYVTAFPTFLFFSPTGDPVHVEIGYKNPEDFIISGRNALDTTKQIFTLYRKYQAGQMRPSEMAAFSQWASQMGQKEISTTVAKRYISQYLMRMDSKQLFTVENLNFIRTNTTKVSDKGFQFMLSDSAKFNYVLGEGAAQRKLIMVISGDEIQSILASDKTPVNWSAIEKTAATRHGYLGRLATYQSKLFYYLHNYDIKEPLEFARAFKLYYDHVGGLNIFRYNDFAWEIFSRVDNDSLLRYAATIMKKYMVIYKGTDDPQQMDTYANLLYKTGSRSAAIGIESQAIANEIKNAVKDNRKADTIYQSTLEKMTSGIQTWPLINAQKPPIDSTTYSSWPYVEFAGITDDGKYVYYYAFNQPRDTRQLIIKAIDSDWQAEIPNIQVSVFNFANPKMGVFVNDNDSLGVVTLGGAISYTPHVKTSFTTAGDWLAYFNDTATYILKLRNLVNSHQIEISAVKNYFFLDNGNKLLVRKSINENGIKHEAVEIINLADTKTSRIWEGAKADNFIFDKSKSQLIFKSEDTIQQSPSTSVWYYQQNDPAAKKLLNQDSVISLTGLYIGELYKFTPDGKKIFLELIKKVSEPPVNPHPLLTIWSYDNPDLSTLKRNKTDITYNAVFNLFNNQIIRLTYDNESLEPAPSDDRDNNNKYVVLYHRDGNGNIMEEHWNSKTLVTRYLLNLEDGSKKQIAPKTFYAIFKRPFQLSPLEHFVVYFNFANRNFYAYNIASGVTSDITKNIKTDWIASDVFADRPEFGIKGIAGWLAGDSSVLVYDRNDIWQLDLYGKKLPLNLTNHYGTRQNIDFTISAFQTTNTLKENQKIILTAFDRKNKNNGFFKIAVGVAKDPELLTMDHYIWETGKKNLPNGEPPHKATDCNAWLVRRSGANFSPNYFFTRDFINYRPVTDVYPEKNFNWYTTELKTWKTPDGFTSQGILYKPENFDPNKKYPVIFYYYEKLSDGLNVYEAPGAAFGPMNILWYVSNGYLVFSPDIHYRTNNAMQSAYWTIVSAAQYLSQMPFIDKNKLGLQGHSFGAEETNYIITHSHLFAAACSASGLSETISDYNGIFLSGGKQDYYEYDQGRMAATLWERPDLYIKQAPLFEATHVSTPLLMMHTTDDNGCPFPNALEFFMALRRLGKKVWLLQYDGDSHNLNNPVNARDYDIRMQQFFNHYLKGSPAPKWMVEGMHDFEKGFNNSLDLEPSNIEPGLGLLTPEDQRKVDALMYKDPITPLIK